jgi:hypothetical protein
MKLYFLLLIFFINFSCSPKVEIIKNDNRLSLSHPEGDLEGLDLVKWKVGKNLEETMNYGFTFKIPVPQFSKSDLDTLKSQYPTIDSWAYKVTKSSQTGNQDVIYMYLPFDRVLKTTDRFTVHLYYQAAAISDRFRRFKCPAMNHRKRIAEYELVKFSHKKNSQFILSSSSLPIKQFALDQIPLIIPGGMELEGLYGVEMALYSLKEKKLYSPFFKINNFIHIKKEETLALPSCIGVREENF